MAELENPKSVVLTAGFLRRYYAWTGGVRGLAHAARSAARQTGICYHN